MDAGGPEPEDREALVGPMPAPASGRLVVTAAVAGAVVFALACLIVDGLARAHVYGSVGTALFMRPYFEPAQAILDGAAPYRDIAIEYPPLSLPVFLLPALVTGTKDYNDYRYAFEILIALIGMAIVPVVLWTLRRLRVGRGDVIRTAALLAISPLLIGSLTISRYDLWPALLTAIAVAFAVAGRRRWAFALVAAGTMAKVYPVVLVPILAIEAWRNTGRREAAIGVGVFLAVVAAVMAPFVLDDPGTAMAPFLRTFARPLQIESLGASILFLAHEVLGLAIGSRDSTFGSFNLVGRVPDAVALVQSVLMLAAVAGSWALYAIRRATPERLVLAIATAILAEVALGKVFSPQYVIWLVPALAAIVPALGPRALVALGAILGLTSLYYPGMYTAYLMRFDLAATVAVVQRNLGLLAFAIYLAVLLRGADAGDARTPDPRPDPGPPSGA
jgi:hypothetical protein